MKFKIKKKSIAKEVLKNIEELASYDVLVGIPSDEANRKGDSEINNAELAYIHEHGSPINNIPARPFLKPSLEANKEKILPIQKAILRDALEGKMTNAVIEMEVLGKRAEDIVKSWFFDPRNGWPPNSPKTIAEKGSDRPLIDTGQMLNAIKYVVNLK